MMDESFSADSRLIQALLKRSLPLTCRAERALFNQGDPPEGLFILEQGEALLVMRSDEGRTVLCLEAGSGSLLGLPGVIGKEPYTLTAFVRDDAKVSFISRENFERTVQEEPGLYPSILQILAAEVHSVRRAIAESGAPLGAVRRAAS